MSEHNTIFNLRMELIANFRHGVAWSKNPRKRLGEYNRTEILSNDGERLAIIEGTTVYSIGGGMLGVVEESDFELPSGHTITKRVLTIEGQPVGECIGNREAAAAAIYFLGEQLVRSNS